MNYIDGYVVPVPKANREIYEKSARDAAVVFRENGALGLVECWGDDVHEGKLTSFPLAVKCQSDETVVFSWVAWPSRELRDAGMKAAMADPRLRSASMPFDAKRMIFGGFQVIVDA